MTDVMVVEIVREGLVTILTVAGPMLLVGLVVGLLVSVFQATTQIHEQTLSFIPKILAIFATMAFSGPWIIRVLVRFAEKIFAYLGQAARW
jgi:flagellar biosynthetic protein FliQ